MIATSPGAPTCSVPSFGARLMIFAGLIVAMVTTAPAKIINRGAKLGTLQVGAPGDVAIMELVEGPVSFVDTRNNKRDGRAYLKPVQTVTAGLAYGRPYSLPFSVR